jgi:hypothetical protein
MNVHESESRSTASTTGRTLVEYCRTPKTTRLRCTRAPQAFCALMRDWFWRCAVTKRAFGNRATVMVCPYCNAARDADRVS